MTYLNENHKKIIFLVLHKLDNHAFCNVLIKLKGLLCEKKEAIVGQSQEGSTGHNYLQQMVQFPESDHLLLQFDLCAQEVALWRK